MADPVVEPVVDALADPVADDPTDKRWLVAGEWLDHHGGAEVVHEHLATLLRPVHQVCLWNDAPERFAAVAETYLGRTPLRRRKAAALPLMPSAWKRVDLAGVDAVVAGSHAFAHHLASRAVREGRQGFAYVHTPARYLWEPEIDGRATGPAGRALAHALRLKDAAGVDPRVHYAANSAYVARRIERCWGVPATVIHPPVEVERFLGLREPATELGQRLRRDLGAGFVLGASRLIRYKQLEMAVATGSALDMPVVIAGAGPDEARLRAVAADAPVPVHFVGELTDPELADAMFLASLYVFMGVEDFGLMPVEAMAAGTPVLVGPEGGARESVELVGGGTCAVSSEPSVLREQAQAALAIDMGAVRQRTATFSGGAFDARVLAWIAGAA